jgi:hypothetical protein
MSTREKWRGHKYDFYKIAHEHLYILRKPAKDEKRPPLSSTARNGGRADKFWVRFSGIFDSLRTGILLHSIRPRSIPTSACVVFVVLTRADLSVACLIFLGATI